MTEEQKRRTWLAELERSEFATALREGAQFFNLRNRFNLPDIGWRINDIFGAPRRAFMDDEVIE